MFPHPPFSLENCDCDTSQKVSNYVTSRIGNRQACNCRISLRAPNVAQLFFLRLLCLALTGRRTVTSYPAGHLKANCTLLCYGSFRSNWWAIKLSLKFGIFKLY
jgi:hypothetical protein